MLVLLNDEIHYAREATKTNTTQLDTFRSPNRGKAGMTNAGRVYFYDPLSTRHASASVFSVDGLSELPRVDIFYAHANMGREYIDHCVALQCKGIVLAGVGDGNATQAAVSGLRDAVTRGVAVVRSSRTNSGITDWNVELNDELGSVASMELNPQKARVLLAAIRSSRRPGRMNQPSRRQPPASPAGRVRAQAVAAEPGGHGGRRPGRRPPPRGQQ